MHLNVVDLVFSAVHCATDPAGPPPDVLLMTSTSLEQLDQMTGTVLKTSSTISSSSHAPQLYNKALRPNLPCRWLQAGASATDSQSVREIKVLQLGHHSFNILPPPSHDAPIRNQKVCPIYSVRTLSAYP